MVEKVHIIKKEKSIKIKFRYNTDLIDIMNDHKGWYFKHDKSWVFPISKLQTIRDELVHLMYEVIVLKENN